MKDSFSQLLAYLKPIKGYGTIGMLQRTIVYSEWVLIISVVISIILQCFNINNDGWIQFFENYAIGIACSVVIVIVITVTQFISERNGVYNDYYYSLFELLSHLDLAYSDQKTNNKKSLNLMLKLIKEDLAENTKISQNLYWFNIKKDEQFRRVITKTYYLKLQLIKEIHNQDVHMEEKDYDGLKKDVISLVRMNSSSEDIGIFKLYQSELDEGENYDQL